MPPKKGIVMTLEGGEKLHKAIIKMAIDTPKLISSAMFTTGFAVLRPYGQQLLKKNKTIFRGALRQKLAVRSLVATRSEGLPTIEFGSFGVSYGQYVEEGSPPRRVSSSEFTQLITYVKRTILQGRSGKKVNAEAIALAQAAADTIEREGQKPHPYLMPTWKAKKRVFWRQTFLRARKKLKAKHGAEG